MLALVGFTNLDSVCTIPAILGEKCAESSRWVVQGGTALLSTFIKRMQAFFQVLWVLCVKVGRISMCEYRACMSYVWEQF